MDPTDYKTPLAKAALMFTIGLALVAIGFATHHPRYPIDAAGPPIGFGIGNVAIAIVRHHRTRKER